MAAQRSPRTGAKVVRLNDGGAGLSSRTVARRLSSLSGFYAFETICEGCTYFATTIEFRPTLRRQHKDAERKAQSGRAAIFKNLLDGLDPTEGPIA